MLDPALDSEGIGRSAFSEALDADWADRRAALEHRIAGAAILVVGAAGTIGSAAVRQLLAFAPGRLELIDIDENGLARLARDIRSRDLAPDARIGFNALDFGAAPGLGLVEAKAPFDLVFNFAAVKHVRSEKNVFTALHMIGVNVVAQRRFARHLARGRLAQRHFVVSTDKAADPASFMGATKLLMEHAVFAEAQDATAPKTSSARFANVAYSSGSLLESYLQRFAAGQALAAPRDTRRYFISAREAARICLIADEAAPGGRIAAPRFDPASGAVELSETAARFLEARGRRAVFVDAAPEAERWLALGGQDYPVLLTERDTSGEKTVEVFRGQGERVEAMGLASLELLAPARLDRAALERVLDRLADHASGALPTPTRAELARLIGELLPGFAHVAAELSLDDRV
ncbi:MAG TPA: polysaccharide biosynthesis protein [Caulobacteraceae bacterium]|nr:polysaccharide biosynthesis protein [Caulobacteraceae bacterium]